MVQTSHPHLELPENMRAKLEQFRRRVWIIKMAEGALAAVFGLLVSYLVVFLSDRLWDTPPLLRLLILLVGTTGLSIVLPIKWHRWVWKTQRLEQVARLLRKTMPRLGDRLLGIVELAESDLEQQRSESLCRAAMKQVDRETRDTDLTNAVPSPRHRSWTWATTVPLAFVLAFGVLVPWASQNALQRWALPWSSVPRYTFAKLQPLPDELHVPIAEPFQVDVNLTGDSEWTPETATVRYGSQPKVRAKLSDDEAKGYEFQLGPQQESANLTVKVGDARQRVKVNPVDRPELSNLVATIELPDYLQYEHPLQKEVRGGTVSSVKGSRVGLLGTTTRELAEVALNGAPQTIQAASFTTSSVDVDETRQIELSWLDELGLPAKSPLQLSIVAMDDEAPRIACNQLERQQVVLPDEVLSFEVQGGDDFGIQQVGLEWKGIADPLRNPHPAEGEKIVMAGAPEQRDLQTTATFSAANERIPAQSLELRLYVVDYLPGRERVYSPPYVIHVLSPEEHAIWLTSQLRKWFRQSQTVYERERELYEVNKELRELPTEELDRPETRRRIESQAAAEQANGRRLTALTSAGEQLIQQAMKNDQFNVETLENWASMLKTLEQISQQRMPSVADLLNEASGAPGANTTGQPAPPTDAQATQTPPKSQGPQVGNNRDPRSGPGQSPPTEADDKPPLPVISDVESGVNELNDDQQQKSDEPPAAGAGKFGLPGTVVNGGGVPQKPSDSPPSPAAEKMDEAITEQEDLLAEFAKVADELQKILDNLEGSTFVKRLKAASRRQLDIATDLNKSLTSTFGLPQQQVEQATVEQSTAMAEREDAQSESVYLIQEDLDAYFNRVQEGKYKTVLNEMRETHVVGNLRRVAQDITDNLPGRSIAQTEFWADALDRWAEQLVGPG